MSEPARQLATWADLLVTPDDGRIYEVLGGNLEAQPRPRPAHGRTQALLVGELSGPFDRGRGGPGGWWLVIEPDVELEPHEIVVPDIVGWRRERMPVLPDERPIAVRPDWICEVASPSNRRRDRGVKLLDRLLCAEGQALGACARLVGRAAHAPERLDHPIHGLARHVPLVEHLERALPRLGPLAHR